MGLIHSIISGFSIDHAGLAGLARAHAHPEVLYPVLAVMTLAVIDLLFVSGRAIARRLERRRLSEARA